MKKAGAKRNLHGKWISNDARRSTALLSQRIEERTNELRSAQAEMDAFADVISHDLRAPLIHIGGFADLLFNHLSRQIDEQGRHYLKTITTSTYQMGRMIDDLLDFSRLNRVELHRMPVDLDAMVRAVIDDCRPLVAQRRVVWLIGHLSVIEADPTLLRQVLSHLVSNALKFTAPRDEARIHLGSRRGEREIVFSIRDNGVGFDMKYREKLFGLFQRLHPNTEFDGNGVGLAHVARIVQRHGGRTWAEGVPGGGATFYFSLPHGGTGLS